MQLTRLITVLLFGTAESLGSGGIGLVGKVIGEMGNILKPAYYLLELKVASQSIPDVSTIPNRKKLKDFPFSASTNKVSFDHSKWDAVLNRHVTVGVGTIDAVTGVNLVNYQGIQQDEDFHQYLVQLEQAQSVDQWEPAEQLSFWMNAYNALCINIILKHEAKYGTPVESITELSNLNSNDSVWNQIAGTVAGRPCSLNDVEHEELRKVWDEPLVHACIVCASASCPNLRPEAFVAPRLQEQMEDQMRLWMKNDTKGIKSNGRFLLLSRIFLWFGDDFGGLKGIRKFLPPFLEDETLKARLEKGNISVRYFDYSWKINRG